MGVGFVRGQRPVMVLCSTVPDNSVATTVGQHLSPRLRDTSQDHDTRSFVFCCCCCTKRLPTYTWYTPRQEAEPEERRARERVATKCMFQRSMSNARWPRPRLGVGHDS